MHSRSGRVFLLIALLLITCYFSDWTDDYLSYWNSVRYVSFEKANGPKISVSGGSMESHTMIATLALRNAQQPSALEAVFGSPADSSRTENGDPSTSRIAADIQSGFSLQPNAVTAPNSYNSRNSFGRGLSGTSTRGFSGGSGAIGGSSGFLGAGSSSIFGPE